MRYEIGIVLSVALALSGCSSGNGGGSAPASRLPTDVELKNLITSFDYVGPLWEPTMEGELSLPNLSACSAGVSEYPFASCIDSVTLDGAPAEPADLRVGQMVEIHGARFNWRGAADASPPRRDSPTVTIDIQRTIVGPVEAIDYDHAWLSVLGQRVYADDAAVADAAMGDMVTVYGHFTATGQILAERVEPYVGDPLFLLRGVLTEPAPGHFAIGGLEVEISGAMREDFPGGAPLPGDTVVARGNLPPDLGVLTAANVRCIGACLSLRWWDGPARGFLTGWRSPMDFDVDGIAIRSEELCDCGLEPPPGLGSFLDVRVSYGSAYITWASSTTRTIGLAGPITAKNPERGEVVVLGYRAHLSPATHIMASPDADAMSDVLPFDSLAVGDAVEITGQASGAGIRVDTIVRQRGANIVKASDYTLAEPAIELAGRTILTQETTRVELCQGDGPMSLGWLFGTAWSDLEAWLLIVVEPSSEPPIAERVIVCPPGYAEPDLHL